MTVTDRVELFDALGQLCRRYPEWRFGQLVANVAGWQDIDIWDVEDEQLLESARRHLQAAAMPTDGDSDISLR